MPRKLITHWQQLVTSMQQHGVSFSAPLSEAETVAAEELFDFKFPEDLREFLQTALPCGEQFPDWRTLDETKLRDWLEVPRDGVLFDVEHNHFWLPEWGERPATLDAAKAAANKLIDEAPKLIPVCGHRMMPTEPSTAGNPVFSVHQTDIIVYGATLSDYFVHEFKLSPSEQEQWREPQYVRAIRFWNIDRFQNTRWGKDK